MPLSTLDNRPVRSVLSQIARLVKSSDKERGASFVSLHKGLALALDLHWKAERNSDARAEIDTLMREGGIRQRKDANPFTALAKLCFPGRHARDYHRYAAALRRAAQSEWSASEFREALAAPGGMIELVREDREQSPEGKRRSNERERAGRLARDRFRKSPLATFYHEDTEEGPLHGKTRVVLLLGEHLEDGTVNVYKVLDSEAHRKRARQIFNALGSATKRNVTKGAT